LPAVTRNSAISGQAADRNIVAETTILHACSTECRPARSYGALRTPEEGSRPKSPQVYRHSPFRVGHWELVTGNLQPKVALNAPLKALLKVRQKVPKKAYSKAYFIAYHIARFSARHIASRIARLKAQRIASFIARCKARSKARVKAPLKAQRKARFKAPFMASSKANSRAAEGATPTLGSHTLHCVTTCR
jgi:hypothetical protein